MYIRINLLRIIYLCIWTHNFIYMYICMYLDTKFYAQVLYVEIISSMTNLKIKTNNLYGSLFP